MTNTSETALFESLSARVGEEIGVTDWFAVTQKDADLFSAMTDDWDYMHNDPAWATPRFGGTIAHGLYVLSLLPHFMKEILPELPIVASSSASSLNYGYNKVRFISHLLIGQRARDRVVLVSVNEKRPGEYLTTYSHTVERENEERPFMVAESCAYYVTNYEEKWRV